MIEVYLYGDLRRHVQRRTISDQSVVQLSARDAETVGSALPGLGIDPTQIG